MPTRPEYDAATRVAAFSFAFLITAASAQAPVAEKPVVPVTRPPAAAPAPATAPPPTPAATKPATAADAAPAKQYVAVGERAAILFDAPSTKAEKTFILLRHTPLEVLVKLDKWTKVRDADGGIGWVENAALGERRHVQVSVASADVHAMPAATAMVVFEARRGVLLEIAGQPADGWLPVRHRDGLSGFVTLRQVWGD